VLPGANYYDRIKDFYTDYYGWKIKEKQQKDRHVSGRDLKKRVHLCRISAGGE